MKYKNKLIIDAEQYKLGMEDGFDTRFYDPKKPNITFGIPTQVEYKTVEVPYLHTFENGELISKNLISKNDWIITDSNGKRTLCSSDIFDKTYEPVKNINKKSANLPIKSSHVEFVTDKETNNDLNKVIKKLNKSK